MKILKIRKKRLNKQKRKFKNLKKLVTKCMIRWMRIDLSRNFGRDKVWIKMI